MTVKHHFELESPTSVVIKNEQGKIVARGVLLLPHKLDIDPESQPKFGKIEVFQTSSGGVRLTLLE